MSDPIRVGWTDIQAGDTLTDGRKVMATDVRTSVNVCRLDDGTVLRVWRRGPGSSVEIASRHGDPDCNACNCPMGCDDESVGGAA